MESVAASRRRPRALSAKVFAGLDSDELVRTQVLTSPAVVTALRDRYGGDIVDADGKVNRAELAARVFPDETELRWLEDLTHPVVFGLWRSAFRSDPAADWAVEVPLLFEKRLEIWFDFTVCVASAPAQQLARLEQRGLPRALAEQRISKQLPLAQKIDWPTSFCGTTARPSSSRNKSAGSSSRFAAAG